MSKLLIAAVTFVALSATVAYACPAGTHPVCTYDPLVGRSVCHCVR